MIEFFAIFAFIMILVTVLKIIKEGEKMAKYVDVEKVFCADCEDRDRCGSPDVFCDVHSMPAADVAPVVHGEWIPFHSEAGGDIQYCSACDVGYPHRTDFCPNCGAKMDGERKGDDATD